MYVVIITRPESAAFAIAELQKYDGGIRPVKDLQPGIKLVSLPGGWGKLITDAPRFIFIRHMFSVEWHEGYTEAEYNILLGKALSNVKKYKRSDGFISRAEFKLMEAIETFQIKIPPKARALDLGAAPGGWSRVLLDKGCRVTAVDPGALDKRIINHPSLSYVCATAQRYFAAQPAEKQFDLMVNDMKMDMYDSVRFMLDAAFLLTPGGAAVMTLKLAKGQGLSKINKALALLEKKYRVINTRQLFHNRDEVTVYISNAFISSGKVSGS